MHPIGSLQTLYKEEIKEVLHEAYFLRGKPLK